MRCLPPHNAIPVWTSGAALLSVRAIPSPILSPVSATVQAKRIVIIEDQTAIREMLAEILRIDPAYKIVGESGDGQQACQLCLDLKPDLLVLDARLPGLSGVDILRRISKQLKNTRVLIFSAYESPALVREMLEAGAHGFV